MRAEFNQLNLLKHVSQVVKDLRLDLFVSTFGLCFVGLQTGVRREGGLGMYISHIPFSSDEPICCCSSCHFTSCLLFQKVSMWITDKTA